MSSIFGQNLSSIDDDHKELSLSKEIDFKIEAETLDTSILKFLVRYNHCTECHANQIQKSSNKGDMTKKPNLTQNLQKLIILTKQILFFWNFENRSVL
jgi:hypothetical protein